MTSELAERLRRANPVSSTEAAPDEVLLSSILAASCEARARRFSRRRGVTLLAAAVIVIGGIAAAASRFAPDYFGADDREPTPAAVMAQLRQIAPEEIVEPGTGEIDPDGIVRVAAFDTEEGRATIYAAPPRVGSGICKVHTLGEEISGWGCSDPVWKTVPHIQTGSSEWDDVQVLVGRLEGGAARIELRFEDRAVRAASIRAPWWAYVVGGDENEPGHRPVEVTALDAEGTVVAQHELDAYSFTSEEAHEALVPESDGSRAQDAMRAMLLSLGSGPWVEQVEIDRTRLLRRFETPAGALEIYSAPWGTGGICYAYASSSRAFEGVSPYGCPSNEPDSDQPRSFEPDPQFVSRLAPSVFVVSATPPRNAARALIRFEDGTSAEPDIFVASWLVTWVGAERLVPGHRPTELVALDPEGRTTDAVRLDPNQFTRR